MSKDIIGDQFAQLGRQIERCVPLPPASRLKHPKTLIPFPHRMTASAKRTSNQAIFSSPALVCIHGERDWRITEIVPGSIRKCMHFQSLCYKPVWRTSCLSKWPSWPAIPSLAPWQRKLTAIRVCCPVSQCMAEYQTFWTRLRPCDTTEWLAS